MSKVVFQDENPSDIDAFPGHSHDRVAKAMYEFLVSKTKCRIVGLDGEFGSGKSSILKLLEKKITTEDKLKVWVFDCEQNYQGSIKSNFIELFTDEIISELKKHPDPQNTKRIEKVEINKKIALGRYYSYTKDTNSHVSPWAIALLTSLFISSTFLKDLLSQVKSQAFSLWWLPAYAMLIFSPAIILLAAWAKNKGKPVGKKKWSMLSLFKGSSDDHISETIEISKDVSPLDLKKVMISHLQAVEHIDYIVVIDNLDRLPKDALRSVWSDLEIFTSINEHEKLNIIVPFCSSKVAKHLNADNDNSYDAKDFISKKFPIVFRAPPIITSGWAETFKTMWLDTFKNTKTIDSEYCALLLKRHSPMNGNLVTPRLQKRFINDIATTALVTNNELSITCIAAYILLCRYQSNPIEQILKKSTNQDNESEHGKNINLTKLLLTKLHGEDMQKGWPIQVLQVHFQTSANIAIAELLDEPLRTAIQTNDAGRFYELSQLFGFRDSFRKIIQESHEQESTFQVISNLKFEENEDLRKILIDDLNRNSSSSVAAKTSYTPEYLKSIKTLIKSGLNKSIFAERISILEDDYRKILDSIYDPQKSEDTQDLIIEYDAYLDAIDATPITSRVKKPDNFFHHIVKNEQLKKISQENLELPIASTPAALKQIFSNEHVSFGLHPLDEDFWLPCLELLFEKHRYYEAHINYGLTAEDAEPLASAIKSYDSPRLLGALTYTKEMTSSQLLAAKSEIGHVEDAFSKLALLSIFIRHGEFDSITEIPELEESIKNNLNLASNLVASTNAFDDIGSALINKQTTKFISPIFKHSINNNKFQQIIPSHVYKNFDSYSEALESEQLYSKEILSWISNYKEAWLHIPNLDEAQKNLIDNIFQDHSDASVAKLRDNFIGTIISSETTEQSWMKILTGISENHSMLVNFLTGQRIDLTNFPNIRTATLRSLREAFSLESTATGVNELIDRAPKLISLINPSSQHILGAEIRTLFYSTNTSLEHLDSLILNFGNTISDIRPSDISENGQLLKILEFCIQAPENTQNLTKLFDSKAEELSKTEMSSDMKKSYVYFVNELKARLPKLHQSLSGTHGYKTFFRNLTRSKKRLQDNKD